MQYDFAGRRIRQTTKTGETTKYYWDNAYVLVNGLMGEDRAIERSNLPLGAGAGIGLNLFGSSIDYACVPFGELGNTHRVSLGLKF